MQLPEQTLIIKAADKEDLLLWQSGVLEDADKQCGEIM